MLYNGLGITGLKFDFSFSTKDLKTQFVWLKTVRNKFVDKTYFFDNVNFSVVPKIFDFPAPPKIQKIPSMETVAAALALAVFNFVNKDHSLVKTES